MFTYPMHYHKYAVKSRELSQSVGQKLLRVCNSVIYRGSYMSAHVLLNLLYELGKRDKMPGLPSVLSLFRNESNKFNNTRA